jgi:hypothetical protein
MPCNLWVGMHSLSTLVSNDKSRKYVVRNIVLHRSSPHHRSWVITNCCARNTCFFVVYTLPNCRNVTDSIPNTDRLLGHMGNQVFFLQSCYTSFKLQSNKLRFMVNKKHFYKQPREFVIEVSCHIKYDYSCNPSHVLTNLQTAASTTLSKLRVGGGGYR